MPANNTGRMGSGGGNGGINVCCCRVCTCVNLEFLTTKNGILKICELILGSLCETLLIRFGLPYASDIGQAFISFLTTVSSCLATVTILLFCYLISAKSIHLIRQSLFVSQKAKLFYAEILSKLIFLILCIGSCIQCVVLYLLSHRILLYGICGKCLSVSEICDTKRIHAVSSYDGSLCNYTNYA